MHYQMADDDNATTTFSAKSVKGYFKMNLAYWWFQHSKRTVTGNILSIVYLKPGEWNFQGKSWICKRDRESNKDKLKVMPEVIDMTRNLSNIG